MSEFPTFDDLFSDYEEISGGYLNGNYTVKATTQSRETNITWKAKVHNSENGETCRGKIGFAFTGELPDVASCDLKSSVTTTGVVKSKLALSDIGIVPGLGLDASAIVDTKASRDSDVAEVSATYESGVYTANVTAELTGDGERSVSASAVTGFNGLLAGMHITMDGEQSYAAAYRAPDEWSIVGCVTYGVEHFQTLRAALVHKLSDALQLGVEYTKEAGEDAAMSLAMQRECTKSGLVLKGCVDTTGAVSCLVRQRIGAECHVAVSLAKSGSNGLFKMSTGVIFESAAED